ncbi:hypothetical protein [Embleya sp. NPDC020630]
MTLSEKREAPHLVRAARVLTAARGLATGTGTAVGTWIVWWVTNH